jgi:putative addiction module component (TIGR02574 family)
VVPLDVDQLTRQEKLDLVERLLQSLQRDEPADDWLTDDQQREIDRRLDKVEADLSAGTVPGRPWPEVLEELRANVRR